MAQLCFDPQELRNWLNSNNLKEPQVFDCLKQYEMTPEAIISANEEDIRDLCKECKFSAAIRIKLLSAKKLKSDGIEQGNRVQAQIRTDSVRPRDVPTDHDLWAFTEEINEDLSYAYQQQLEEIHGVRNNSYNNNTPPTQLLELLDYEYAELVNQELQLEEKSNHNEQNLQQDQEIALQLNSENLDDDFTSWPVQYLSQPQLQALRNRGPCTICCENFDTTTPVKRLVCGCHFHAHCIDEWVETSQSTYPHKPVECPIDRTTIVKRRT